MWAGPSLRSAESTATLQRLTRGHATLTSIGTVNAVVHAEYRPRDLNLPIEVICVQDRHLHSTVADGNAPLCIGKHVSNVGTELPSVA
jgi:hypothetical protein